MCGLFMLEWVLQHVGDPAKGCLVRPERVYMSGNPRPRCLYASEGEITDITLKKFVQSNSTYQYMLHVSVKSESINNTGHCRETPLSCPINSCLREVFKTHTQY